jgi:hypothetical protein
MLSLHAHLQHLRFVLRPTETKLIDLTREGVNNTGAAGRGHVHESERGNVA